ncbi:ATP-binding protein [Bradyrhizobium sp. HKCCYLRH3059]|uniref:ATP-binding protein n=1 Tax=unclassified Bradyrhizobium TaxID=2631580 RepID=UPI002916F425|nr:MULTISPECIES: ATP-binding protein [unclassified Bradyrhizobium]
MTTSAVAALQVVDEDFLIASLIERCPKSMMIRELMMNALEAAQHAPVGSRVVEISAMPMDGVDKLVIWNTGPGMDDLELLKICNIASSLGKEKSLTGNFGMGAKVASLPSNQRGMRYRSCKNGRVHEVILCKRDGVYGRLRRYDSETDTYVEVVDVTDIAEQNGRTLSVDWTEVMLLGNDPEQDTVRDPYNGDPEQDAQWLATYLYHRFYGLPEGVRVTLLKGTNKLDGNRQFEPIPARLRHFERHETVSLPDGMKIHYLYDAQYNGTGHNKSISGAIASAVSTCGVVYKNELYDLSKGRQWTFEAPVFGVPFGAKYISIHIELPNNFPVVPEAYRQFLQYTGGEQLRLQSKDFEELVRENRPEWLIELIHSFAPDSRTSDEIRDELQRLLNQLRVRRVSPKAAAQGETGVTPGAGPASERGQDATGGGRATESVSTPRSKPTDLSVMPAGAKRAEMFKNLERAPEIIPLLTDEDIDEKGLKGRAARYVMEAGQLFVNMKYPAINEMRLQLEAEYAGANDPELMRSLAQQHAQDSMVLRVGRTVVYALAKQLNKEWDQKALEAASSPESLSMAADNFADAMQNIRRAIGKALRVSRVEVDAA